MQQALPDPGDPRQTGTPHSGGNRAERSHPALCTVACCEGGTRTNQSRRGRPGQDQDSGGGDPLGRSRASPASGRAEARPAETGDRQRVGGKEAHPPYWPASCHQRSGHRASRSLWNRTWQLRAIRSAASGCRREGGGWGVVGTERELAPRRPGQGLAHLGAAPLSPRQTPSAPLDRGEVTAQFAEPVLTVPCLGSSKPKCLPSLECSSRRGRGASEQSWGRECPGPRAPSPPRRLCSVPQSPHRERPSGQGRLTLFQAHIHVPQTKETAIEKPAEAAPSATYGGRRAQGAPVTASQSCGRERGRQHCPSRGPGPAAPTPPL